MIDYEKAEVKSIFDIKFNEIVMRYLISHLPSDQSLEYKKPNSFKPFLSSSSGVMAKIVQTCSIWFNFELF